MIKNVNNKNSFVFYFSWATLLTEMPDEVRHSVMDAILQYVTNGTLPEDDSIKYGVFSIIKHQLDEDNEKWEHTRRVRSVAGKLGNEVRWGKSDASTCDIANIASVAVNDNVNVNVNKETAKAVKKAPLSLSLPQRLEVFKETLAQYKEEYGAGMLNDFFEYWTEPNKSGTKMRFELQKTWEFSRRLSHWARNDFNK